MMRSALVSVYGLTFSIKARSASSSESSKLWPAALGSFDWPFQAERSRVSTRRERTPAGGRGRVSDAMGISDECAGGRGRQPRAVDGELGVEIDDAFDPRGTVNEEVQRYRPRGHDAVVLHQCHLREVGPASQVRSEPSLDLHDVARRKVLGRLQWAEVH